MKFAGCKGAAVVAAFLFFASLAWGAGSRAWKLVVLKPAGISIALPSFPEKLRVDVSPAQTANYTVYYVHLKNPHQAYEVVYFDFTDRRIVEGAYQEHFLAGAVKGEAANTDARVVSERPIRLGRYRGREAVLETRDAVLTTRWFVVNRRIYHIAVLMDKGRVVQKDVNRFLTSLRLLRR